MLSIFTELSSYTSHPKREHIWLLFKFFIFNILLLTVDVGTDINTAWNFYQRGDIKFSFISAVIIFIPFFAQFFLWLINFIGFGFYQKKFDLKKKEFFDEFKLKIKTNRFKDHFAEFILLFCHLPMVEPLR